MFPQFLIVLVQSSALAAWMPALPEHGRYGEAAAHLSAGELTEAEAGFRGVIDADATCGMARHGLGVTLLRKGQLKSALEQLEAVASGWPDRPEGHTALSVARFAAQDFAGARAAGLAAVGAAPSSVDANAALLEVLLRQGDLAEARTTLDAARAAGVPSGAVACLEVQVAVEAKDQKTVDKALPLCLRSGQADLVVAARSRAGGPDGGAVGAAASQVGARDLMAVAQAVDLMRDGETGPAVTILDEVLTRSPTRTDARLLRARARAAQGDRAGARADLEQTFNGKTWVDVHASGAMSGILRKSDERALLREIARGAGLLVDLLREEGKLDEADARLKEFQGRWPEATPLIIADARLRMGRGDTEGAWAAIDSAIARTPADPDLLQTAGQFALLSPAGMPPRVQARITSGGDWRDRYNLALAERKAGRAPGCRDIASEALSGAGQPTTAEDRARVANLVHRCAVEATDLTVADRVLAEAGGPGALSATLAYNHALLRQQAGDPSGAWALVSRHAIAPPADPAVAAATATLGLRLALELGDLASGLQIAAQPAAPAEERVRLVTPLRQAGRLDDADRVLRTACPDLTGESRARCDAQLEQSSGE